MSTKAFILTAVILAILGGGAGAAYAVATDDDVAPQAESATFTIDPSTFGSGALQGGGQAPAEGGDPEAGSQAPGGLGAFGGFGGNVLSGTIVSLDDDTLTLTANDGESDVRVTAETLVTIQKPIAEAGGLLTAGTDVTVVGAAADGGTTTANIVTLGALSARLGGLGIGGRGGFGGISFVTGTIASFDGMTIRVTTSDGTSDVRVSPATMVATQVSLGNARGELIFGTAVTVVIADTDGGPATAALINLGTGSLRGIFGGFGQGGQRGRQAPQP